jgi:hypothetical protein
MCEADQNKTIAAIATASLTISVTAEATVRRGFANPHLKAAEHFSRVLEQFETENLGAGWGDHFEFSTSNASAAIILSFAAIEAAIDEAEDDLSLPRELTDALDKASTLDHAQALLAHRGCVVFVKGAEPFQSADLLRAIRNGLVHPKAEWDNARERNRKLSDRINGARLPLSPFQPALDLAFPHGCMSAGVAKWAALTARSFIAELRLRLGLPKTI